MGNVLLVGLGGFVGAVLRYGVSAWCSSFSRGFPLGTLVVNSVGCFAIGLLMGVVGTRGAEDPWRMFLGIGLLGAFTTFSTFGYETVELMRDQRFGHALLSVAANVVVGVLCVMGGRALVS